MGPTALPKSIENDGCGFTTSTICKCTGDLTGSHRCKSRLSCGTSNEKTADRTDDRAVVGNPGMTLSAQIPEKTGKNLTELRLSGQGLKFFPETDDLSCLLTLDLSHNEIPEVPSKLRSSTHLRVLNLSHNRLTELPKVLLEGLAVLKTLNVSFNTLNILPRPACVQHLEELTARSCHLIEFPPWILYERHCVETLDLSINPIFDRYLPDERLAYHSSVRSLKKINLSNTYACERIRTLFAQFTGLEHVDVGNNYGLKYINRILGCQQLLGPSLKIFKAVDVGLATNPELKSCSQLDVINLSRNPMSWINPDFVINSLRIIILPNCYICTLPDNFGDMVNLEYLNLSHNDLSLLPASFNKLVRLKHVDLYHNSFSEFPEELQSLKQITCLDLCSNYFEPSSHLLGDDVACYEELRRALRATLVEERSTGGLAKPTNDVYLSDDGSGKYKNYASSSSSVVDSDEENRDQPQRPVFIRPLPVSQPDEDWDVLEPPIFQSDDHFSDRGLQHPFVPEYSGSSDLNVHFMQYLQLVPDRIRNSPFYYHRIDTSSQLTSVRKFSRADIAEGQFDD